MYRFILVAVLAVGFSSVSVARDFRLLRLDGQFVKWGEQRWQSGAQITYSFARQETRFADAINCKSMVPLDALLDRSGISRTDFEISIRQAFDKWEGAANLSFVFVEDPNLANILIGAQGLPRDIAYTNVWHGSTAEREIAEITRSVFCLNPDIAWETDLDGDDETFDVERVAAHEIGHAIGLDHPGPSGALMGYRYTEAVNALEAGDIDGVRRLYGGPLRASRD